MKVQILFNCNYYDGPLEGYAVILDDNYGSEWTEQQLVYFLHENYGGWRKLKQGDDDTTVDMSRVEKDEDGDKSVLEYRSFGIYELKIHENDFTRMWLEKHADIVWNSLTANYRPPAHNIGFRYSGKILSLNTLPINPKLVDWTNERIANLLRFGIHITTNRLGSIIY